MEDRVRDSLHRRAAAAEPSEEMWGRISSHTSSPPVKGPRVAVTVVALLIGTAAIAFIVFAFGNSEPRTTPMPGDTEEGPPPMDARIAHTVDVGATAYSVAADGGSTWVVTYDFERGSGSVVHVDASSGRVVGRIRVDGFAYNIAAGGGSIWVAAKDARGRPALVRIDGRSDRITGTVPGVTGPIAVDASGVWAVQGASVVRIDPAPLEVDARIPLGAAPLDLSVGGGSVWALGRTVDDYGGVSSGPLTQIDAATATVVRRVEFASTGEWLASANEGVWVASDGVAFVANAGGPPQAAGNVYNFRPFSVADQRVWFISGPHDSGLPKGGVCGLNITTQRVDVCAEPPSIVDFAGAHDALALDPVSQTLWVSQYESSLVTGIQLSTASSDTTP
jgi:hypothetical protein